MRDTFTCTMRSSAGVSFDAVVQSVAMPTLSGEVQVLAGHAEAYVALAPGQIVVRDERGTKKMIDVSGGIFHIKDDRAIIIF